MSTTARRRRPAPLQDNLKTDMFQNIMGERDPMLSSPRRPRSTASGQTRTLPVTPAANSTSPTSILNTPNTLRTPSAASAKRSKPDFIPSWRLASDGVTPVWINPRSLEISRISLEFSGGKASEDAFLKFRRNKLESFTKKGVMASIVSLLLVLWISKLVDSETLSLSSKREVLCNLILLVGLLATFFDPESWSKKNHAAKNGFATENDEPIESPSAAAPPRFMQEKMEGIDSLTWLYIILCSSSFLLGIVISFPGPRWPVSYFISSIVPCVFCLPLRLSLIFATTLLSALLLLHLITNTPASRTQLLISVAGVFLSAAFAHNAEYQLKLQFSRASLMKLARQTKRRLLLRMLPQTVIDRLDALPNPNQVSYAENFENVAVLFAEVCDFEDQELQPNSRIGLLNAIFGELDQLTQKHEIFKVESIGPIYMCASGLPDRPTDFDHIRRIAEFSKELLRCSSQFFYLNGKQIQFKVGIHVGPVMAGVVGKKLPRFRLFGDTVNTASRMCSHSQPSYIHCSASFAQLARVFETSGLSPRGRVFVKGKGDMHTFWLLPTISPTATEKQLGSAAKSFKPGLPDLSLPVAVPNSCEEPPQTPWGNMTPVGLTPMSSCRRDVWKDSSPVHVVDEVTEEFPSSECNIDIDVYVSTSSDSSSDNDSLRSAGSLGSFIAFSPMKIRKKKSTVTEVASSPIIFAEPTAMQEGKKAASKELLSVVESNFVIDRDLDINRSASTTTFDAFGPAYEDLIPTRDTTPVQSPSTADIFTIPTPTSSAAPSVANFLSDVFDGPPSITKPAKRRPQALANVQRITQPQLAESVQPTAHPQQSDSSSRPNIQQDMTETQRHVADPEQQTHSRDTEEPLTTVSCGEGSMQPSKTAALSSSPSPKTTSVSPISQPSPGPSLSSPDSTLSKGERRRPQSLNLSAYPSTIKSVVDNFGAVHLAFIKHGSSTSPVSSPNSIANRTPKIEIDTPPGSPRMFRRKSVTMELGTAAAEKMIVVPSAPRASSFRLLEEKDTGSGGSGSDSKWNNILLSWQSEISQLSNYWSRDLRRNCVQRTTKLINLLDMMHELPTANSFLAQPEILAATRRPDFSESSPELNHLFVTTRSRIFRLAIASLATLFIGVVAETPAPVGASFIGSVLLSMFVFVRPLRVYLPRVWWGLLVAIYTGLGVALATISDINSDSPFVGMLLWVLFACTEASFTPSLLLAIIYLSLFNSTFYSWGGVFLTALVSLIIAFSIREFERDTRTFRLLTLRLNIEERKTGEIISELLPRSVVEALEKSFASRRKLISKRNFDEDTAAVVHTPTEPLGILSLICPFSQSLRHVCMLFADIVGFTPASSQLSAAQLVPVLASLFNGFDDIVEKHGVFKVETIGDCYFCASGVPTPVPNQALAIARAAIDMNRYLIENNVHIGDHKMQLRIGIHAADICSGVIGCRMPRYHLFGKGTIEAQRCESQGAAGKINVSLEFAQLLRSQDVDQKEFELFPRDPLPYYFLSTALK